MKYKLGFYLKALRKQEKMKLKNVAQLTGLSVSFISDIERDRTVPSLKTLAKLAKVYNATVSELLEDVEL